MVVLSGPPGIGKSSLVLEAAYRNGWRFPGGVAYAAGPRPEDARTTTAAEMLAALAGALGLERADDLLSYTAANPTLLLLDNLESLPPQDGSPAGISCGDWAGRAQPCWPCVRPATSWRTCPLPGPCLCTAALEEAAARYALALANQRRIPLTREQALISPEPWTAIPCWWSSW